jgi:hypothetical protein
MILWILLILMVMSPFSSQILLIHVFSLLGFVMLARGLSILLIFSKKKLFVSLTFFCIVRSGPQYGVASLLLHCHAALLSRLPTGCLCFIGQISSMCFLTEGFSSPSQGFHTRLHVSAVGRYKPANVSPCTLLLQSD